MSDLTDKIAAEHPRLMYSVGVGHNYVCGCGDRLMHGHTRHVAEVTEAAVRAQIAADIEAARGRHADRSFHTDGIREGLGFAARIAKGGA